MQDDQEQDLRSAKQQSITTLQGALSIVRIVKKLILGMHGNEQSLEDEALKTKPKATSMQQAGKTNKNIKTPWQHAGCQQQCLRGKIDKQSPSQAMLGIIKVGKDCRVLITDGASG